MLALWNGSKLETKGNDTNLQISAAHRLSTFSYPDKPGNVCHSETEVIAKVNAAHIWIECSEWICGYLGMSIGHGCEERGFAGVWEAH